MKTSTQKDIPSNRSFGALFSTIFAGLSIYTYLNGSSKSIWLGWIAAATFVGLLVFLAPKLLAPFNKLWFLLGEILGKIVSPLVLAVIFFVVLAPVGIIGRILGRDALRLKCNQDSSYWIDRSPPGPAPETFKNQF